MPTSDHVSDLLLRWEELRDEGKPVAPEELCRASPELTDEVRRGIAALEAVYRVPNGVDPQAETRGDAAAATLAPRALPQIPGYEILGVLGHGGMGIVYQARQLSLGRDVALKMILTGAHASPRDLERFHREAQTVARLQHPNIVQIYEVGQHEGNPYLALELVQGGNLADRLAGKPLPGPQAAELVETLARAAHYAHERGIVHRDLKPGNVLLQKSDVRSQKSEVRGQRSGSNEQASGALTSDLWPLTSDLCPKITDFGLAKRFDGEGEPTQTGTVMGTPSYMAPEQAAGQTRAIGPATDIYALGAILYEALTGRPPFQGASPLETLLQISGQEPPAPRSLNARLERDLETICLKCLEKEPHDRYQSAAALADDLRRFRSGELIHARGITLVDRVARTLNRTDQAKQFHALGTLLGRVSPVPLVTHALAFLVWNGEPYYGGAAVLTTLATIVCMLAFILTTILQHGLLDWGPSSRHFWSIRVGHFLGLLLVPVLCWQLAPEAGTNWLTVYPFWGAVTAVTFFPLGSNFWGRLYLFGLAFFVAAPLMALKLEWAPLELGFLVTTVLLVVGAHLRRIDREFQREALGP